MRRERLNGHARATVRCGQHEEYDAVLRNVSTNGYAVRCDAVLAVGASCDLRAGNGEWLAGAVRWARGGSYGVVLAEPITAARVKRLVAGPPPARPRAALSQSLAH